MRGDGDMAGRRILRQARAEHRAPRRRAWYANQYRARDARVRRTPVRIIINLGFAQAPIVETVAKDYPDIKFAIVDGVSQLPNVASLVFKEHEGSYLVGILAAMTTRTGTRVSGRNGHRAHSSICDRLRGRARSVNPNIRVIRNYVGVTDAAWNNPRARGRARARANRQGADIIFTAAGNSGLGALTPSRNRDAGTEPPPIS